VLELAVCLPVIMLLVLGSIEAASLIFIKQAMVQTAYEASIVAIKNNSTNADAIAAANQVVRGHRLNGLTLSFSPADVARAPRGSVVAVTATVPAGSHRLINSRIIGVDQVSATALMIKE
jgi:Flp pilus assembly protein TadG